jgi:tetratricopeptide (TPR) repeat protein
MNLPDKISTKVSSYCEKNNIQLTDENFQEVLKKAVTEEEFKACFLLDTISKKIDALAIYGDKLVDEGKNKEAIKVFNKGLKCIPNPKYEHEATLWFMIAIADTYWFMENFKTALYYLNESLKVITGSKNPFVRFRRGQVLFELGKFEKAKQELFLYSKLDDGSLFMDEDRKYLKFFNQNVKDQS